MRAKFSSFLTTMTLLVAAPAWSASAGYDAREWGVLDLQTGSESTLRTEAPPTPREHIVKAPVLYFTTRDRLPFSLTVSFPHGGPLETYPQALTQAASLTWPRVEFTAGATPVADPVPACDADRVQALGTVLAAPLLAQGQATRFLYYEARTALDAPLTARWEGQRLILTNTGSWPLGPFTISTACGFRLHTGSTWGFGSLTVLKPGATAALDLDANERAAHFPDLRADGFEAGEAAAFEAYWRAPVMRPFLQHAWAKVLYRLPPAACDQVARLTFEPSPKALVRALFILQDLPPKPRPIEP